MWVWKWRPVSKPEHKPRTIFNQWFIFLFQKKKKKNRLGPAQHTQYNLKPLSNFVQPITALALGQDHTLALTKSGEVFSWGLNRFSQLGYVVEISMSSTGRHEEPIQTIPKRVVGLLRREVVIGVAASRIASACWTKETVFTWGTNTGQLGRVFPLPFLHFELLIEF